VETYKIFLHMDLLDAIPSKGSRREEIFRFIRGLALSPATPGDYTDRDDTLRPRQVKIVGDHAVTCWVDDPARTVPIVGARPADR
jgi:hypothetical protein